MKPSSSSARIWRITSIASIIATLLLIGGFVYAVNDVVNPVGSSYTAGDSAGSGDTGSQAAVDPATEGIRIAAMGDSLAKGTGDDEGSGFVRRTVNLLQQQGVDAKLVANLGINGQKTNQVLSSLEQSGVQHTLRQSNVIMLSIGANDLFNGGEALGNLDEQAPTAKQLLTNQPQAAARLQKILDRLAEINPDAQIIYLGLYNPFGDLKELRVPGNQAVSAWNMKATGLTNTNEHMMVIPTFDLFQNNLDQYLSADHFHPNGDGYEQIAQRIVQSIR
ncbi:GDSL-type esterase/lipase family protein [Paenibacillus wulumuqiensis]|uniref:GDSL-type esterase/lipase family protein n=1 Tax=Paenibacillus wulumuqiensis TaxID=1567107 RepID=UPI0006194906|nr:GDSL-type esterase/lipase family protein [Paenibacillus wulumuqiensis]